MTRAMHIMLALAGKEAIWEYVRQQAHAGGCASDIYIPRDLYNQLCDKDDDRKLGLRFATARNSRVVYYTSAAILPSFNTFQYHIVRPQDQDEEDGV